MNRTSHQMELNYLSEGFTVLELLDTRRFAGSRVAQSDARLCWDPIGLLVL